MGIEYIRWYQNEIMYVENGGMREGNKMLRGVIAMCVVVMLVYEGNMFYSILGV